MDSAGGTRALRHRRIRYPIATEGHSPLPDEPSVADLPLTNLSGDAEQEYLADLLTGSPARERKERSHREIDQEVARKAALAYEKWRRDAESRKEEAARENARQRRKRTIEKVQAALDKAERRIPVGLMS